MTYFEAEDILHLAITDEAEAQSLELSPNIAAELRSDDTTTRRFGGRLGDWEIGQLA